jgi:hypothetical protein
MCVVLIEVCRMMFIFPINESANPLRMNIYCLHSGYVGDTDDISDITPFSVKYEQ